MKIAIYRHITNLSAPFKGSDLEFLSMLDDYRLGAPVPLEDGPLLSVDLLLAGIIGLYTTRSALMSYAFRKRTGWGDLDKQLGQPWRPLSTWQEPGNVDARDGTG